MSNDDHTEEIRQAGSVEELFKALEQYDLPPVSDFHLAFGMTADHMREHHPDAYRCAVTLELREAAPADGENDANPAYGRGREK